MPKNKKQNTSKPDVFKSKKITNPYDSKWFHSPDTKPMKRLTAVFTK